MLGIDDLIAFAEGPAADIMGAEAAAGMLAGAKARKAEGWKYCICEAHTAAAELDFEKAAELRDEIKKIRALGEE